MKSFNVLLIAILFLNSPGYSSSQEDKELLNKAIETNQNMQKNLLIWKNAKHDDKKNDAGLQCKMLNVFYYKLCQTFANGVVQKTNASVVMETLIMDYAVKNLSYNHIDITLEKLKFQELLFKASLDAVK